MNSNNKFFSSPSIIIPVMGIIILVLLAIILAMLMLGRSPVAAAPTSTFTLAAAQPPTQTQPALQPTFTISPIGGTPEDAVKNYYSSLRNGNIGIILEEWTTSNFSQRLNNDKETRELILNPKKGANWQVLKIGPVDYSSFQMALVQYEIEKKDYCELLEMANPETTGNHWRVAEVSEADCITGEKIAVKPPTATPVTHFVYQFTQMWCGNEYYGSRLFPGMAAKVSTDPPLPNNLRSAPGKQEPRIGELAPGEEVRILDGPRCVDGWIWWDVRSIKNGERGWTSEGDENTYWLVPSRMPGS